MEWMEDSGWQRRTGMATIVMYDSYNDVCGNLGGKYYCGIDRTGKDWYETFSIVVSRPSPEPVKPLIEPAFEPATKEEMVWMGSEGAGKRGTNPEVQKAMMKCQGNKACTLALLQKEELEINTSCWLCLQMSRAWKAAPLTVATMNETSCLIPRQMTEVLMAAADIEQGRCPNPFGLQTYFFSMH